MEFDRVRGNAGLAVVEVEKRDGRDESGLGRYAVAKAGPGRLVDACAASLLALEAHAQAPVPVEPWVAAW